MYRQASTETVSYLTIAKKVIAEEGITGLMGRGLKTKILANGLQGLMFSVLWKYIDEAFFGHTHKTR